MFLGYLEVVVDKPQDALQALGSPGLGFGLSGFRFQALSVSFQLGRA